MNDARRYRVNAAECLSAAKTCGLHYRGLTLDIANSWLALARQAEAEDELVASWGSQCRGVRSGNPTPRLIEYAKAAAEVASADCAASG
jgi:hypothetical protein